jgi:integrase
MTTNRNATAAPRKDPKTGTWWFIVDLGKGPNGKRRQARRRGFATKAQALEELTKVRRNVTTQTYVAPAKQTFSEYVEKWIKGLPTAGLAPPPPI